MFSNVECQKSGASTKLGIFFILSSLFCDGLLAMRRTCFFRGGKSKKMIGDTHIYIYIKVGTAVCTPSFWRSPTVSHHIFGKNSGTDHYHSFQGRFCHAGFRVVLPNGGLFGCLSSFSLFQSPRTQGTATGWQLTKGIS